MRSRQEKPMGICVYLSKIDATSRTNSEFFGKDVNGDNDTNIC